MQGYRVLKRACVGIASAGLVLNGSLALAQPAAYCNAQAREFANSYSSPGHTVVRSAAVGAVDEAVVGSILSGKRKSVGRGAVIGAGAGTAAGLASAGGRWQQDYDYAYQRCMTATNRKRAPPAGTPAWVDYCSAKYRSFDAGTGMYLSYSGDLRPCL